MPLSILETICGKFPITESEFELLDDKFGKLCYYAACQLKKNNTQHYGSKEAFSEDDVQELKIALMRAGSYYKRQTYIERCFQSLDKHVQDRFIKTMVVQLKSLWTDRRRHGASRQKFGEFQERILDKLVMKYVPEKERPCKNAPLKMDSKFSTYCKQIMWNELKSLGKKITKEKSWRTNLVSLSEFDYLASNV